MEIFDSWTVKLGILGFLLATRFILGFGAKPDAEKASAEKPNEFSAWARESLDSALLTLVLVFGVLQPFVAQAYYIPTGSMMNTLPPDDRILTSKWIYRVSDPKFQDVVVFVAPPEALAGSGLPQGTNYVKRCIGTPGDVIEFRNRVLYRNGVKVNEPYTLWQDSPNEPFSYDLKIVEGAVYYRMYYGSGQPGEWMQNESPVVEANQDAITKAKPGKVPDGFFLMLGDHRCASQDGHIWGFLPRQNVVGKAFAVFWPPSHWGTVDHKSTS